jgi:hypothetical protein
MKYILAKNTKRATVELKPRGYVYWSYHNAVVSIVIRFGSAIEYYLEYKFGSAESVQEVPIAIMS